MDIGEDRRYFDREFKYEAILLMDEGMRSMRILREQPSPIFSCSAYRTILHCARTMTLCVLRSADFWERNAAYRLFDRRIKSVYYQW